MSPNSLSLVKKVVLSIVLSIVLIGYPYFIDYIVRWINGKIMSIYSNLPKNVYNDL